MQNYPLLLRRPLPPKLPKLPLCEKKVQTGKTEKISPPHAKVTQDETPSAGRDKAGSPDVAGKQLQTHVTIRNLSLSYHVPERVATAPIPQISSKKINWNIPETTTDSIFFPSFHSASGRVFEKETKHMRRSRRPKEGPSETKEVSGYNLLNNILIFSEFSKPSSTPPPSATPKRREPPPDHTPLPNKGTDTLKRRLTDSGGAVPRPLPGIPSVQAKTQRPDHLQQHRTAQLTASRFPETGVAETVKQESVPKPSKATPQKVRIKPTIEDEPAVEVMPDEDFKTVETTQNETIVAMTNLAIVNCQVHGRNALSLKGFFILNCPDLTPLALQLIYLNLSYNHISSFPTEVFCLKYLQILILRNNPIKVIPSEIQKLKFLRVLSIAFNLISTLPPGLFSLPYLEELDISYNSIAFISNEIQKLRSLKKLIVDGNDLTSFPSGILKLNLKKILFKNNYTHPSLWRENSLNSPQRLTQLTSLFFVKNNLHKYYDVIPRKIQMLLNCTSTCDWCYGPKFGEGYRVIQSCSVFGVSHLPVLFQVCSSPCYRKVAENGVL